MAFGQGSAGPGPARAVPWRAADWPTVELRAASLLGTDVVAVALWPDPDDDPAPRVDHPSGMPLEVRCVDQATAVIVEDLARNDPRRFRHRPGPIVLHELIARAEGLRRRGGGAAAA